MPRSKLEFGRVQMRIMKVLWDKNRITAREITDELNKYEPIAHSTVQTLMRTLEHKGAVAHDLDDRTFIFYPLVENESVVKHATGTFIERIFSGSTGNLVSYLLKNQYISKDEVKKISDLI